MAWQYFYGAYDNTGPYANVVLGGSPDNTGPFGAPLATAHASGYGKGINFSDNGNYGVTSLYRDGNSDKNISIKTYYASSIAQGLVLSDLELKTLKNNRILVYRSSASYVDILIDYLQVEY